MSKEDALVFAVELFVFVVLGILPILIFGVLVLLLIARDLGVSGVEWGRSPSNNKRSILGMAEGRRNAIDDR